MTLPLRASLRELENRNPDGGGRAELCCELAKEFENKGEYEKARKVLGHYWQHIGERPNLKGLEPSTAGELLLRAGVLTSAIGSKTQFTEAQETAKNLISESLTLFQSTNNQKKTAEAQTELALCYWRTGEINEARDLLKDALSRLTIDSELRAKAVARLAIVERTAPNYVKALRLLTQHARLFQTINNHTLKGSYHVTLGTVLENLWESKNRAYVDRALIEYAAASYHFEQAGHRSYLASVENNLGFLYFKINRCEQAHEHLDHARRVLVSLKDFGTIAQVDETRARVFLKQGRLIDAEVAARAAVRSLEKSGRHALLAEALITHGRALARLKRYGAALGAFRRSADLSTHTGNLTRAAEATLAAFQELREHLVAWEGGHHISGRGWGNDKQSREHDVIKIALQNAKGSITHAARDIGVSYQWLSYKLRTKYKDLLKERTPARHRKRRM
jgi:tetratricopeptide (TPR) repeat protein